jgi:hypothetical protein
LFQNLQLVLVASSLRSAVTPIESMTSFGYGERVSYIAFSGFPGSRQNEARESYALMNRFLFIDA